MNKTVKPFSMRDYLGYAMGDFGCNMSFALVSNYMMLFFTQYIGVSLKDWAWIIIVGKVWDAINDPIIGGLVDRVRISKNSKFTPWITIGGALLVICTTLTFIPIRETSYTFRVIYCLLAYCIWSVAYTMANVPYGAMHSAITDDPAKRTNLSTFRSIGAGLAQAPLMLLPMLLYDDNENLKGDMMIWVALICSVIGFIGFMLVKILATERVEVVENKEKFNYISTVKSFFTNRPLVAITVVSVLNIICFMSMTSTNTIIFQSFFHNTDLLALTNIASYLPMIIVMPLVGLITKKIGKKGFLEAITAISTIGGVVMLMIPLNPEATSSIFIWIVGLMFLYLSNAGLGVIVWAMVVDCIDYSYKRRGVKEEGSTYALYSFFRKLAAGVGSAFAALALAACGYVEELGAAQTAETALNIKNMYLLVMTIGVAISFVIMKFVYNIKEKKADENEVATE